MIRITYTYTKSSDVQWFEDFYADNAEMMELYDYHISYFRSLPGCTFTFTGRDSDIGRVELTFPSDSIDPELNLDNDPKIKQFLEIVADYYSTRNVSMERIRETI